MIGDDKLEFKLYDGGDVYIDIYGWLLGHGEVRIGHIKLIELYKEKEWKFVPNQKALKIVHLEQILEKLKELNNVGQETRPQV